MEKFLRQCRDISFGEILTGSAGKSAREPLNRHLISLCRSLPLSQQGKALDFLLDYSGHMPCEPFDFFRKFHPPAWTIIQHLAKKNKFEVTREVLDHALRGQTMAMFLHSLDDHLVDGSLPLSHLALLIRTQAWSVFMDTLEYFAGITGRTIYNADCLKKYFEGIEKKLQHGSLDDYCNLFRQQMATWVVIPSFVAFIAGADIKAVQDAYGSFGVAWRLLDDLNDIAVDIESKTKTALFFSLTEGRKKKFMRLIQPVIALNDRRTINQIGTVFLQGKADTIILNRIAKELDHASSLATRCRLSDLADEYDQMAGPIKKMLQR